MDMKIKDGRSPLSPLPPHQGTFNFSPSVVNRILEKGSTPTVLKTGQTKSSRRSFTPLHSRKPSASPMISPIFKVPKNSPYLQSLPTRHERKNLRPVEDCLVIINLISPDIVEKREKTSPMAKSPLADTSTSSSGSSSMNTSAQVGNDVFLDSSFNSVVREAVKSAPVNGPHVEPDHAHLNEHLSVLNVLDDIHMGHLGPLFEREEIDMNVFTMMSSTDLESIGVVGAEQEAVLAAIKTFND